MKHTVSKFLWLGTIFFAIVAHPLSANAVILFQNDTTATFPGSNLLINSSDHSGDIIIQFGSALGESIRWSDADGWFEVSNNLSLSSNQLLEFRLHNASSLPGGAGGPGAGAIGQIVQLTSTDSTAPGCTVSSCAAGTYIWNGTAWDSAQ